MKFYANHPQDREDIVQMRPSQDEIRYIRHYLDTLRIPSRQAEIDQVVSAFMLLDAMEELFHGG